MSDVRTVYTTSEVAEILDITPSYLLRLAQSMELTPAEFRSAGKRNYLFSKEAVEKLKNRNK
ncbi:helix-turn-helix domain-containing protein [Butyricicoccus faecihominis]|uniref:helix-turn-helix domain-containing protein n=1 Tax=Butyricicoccus faecihominis TaxID=1712515 RepID=UPI0024793B6B|nr:helix-turn-helix domain-containing protein [Butyricicoccus faecihominis]MCQ5128709.1 helix-turn-helix domain-containing protein [Butyricicoccus faecihominis]